MLRFLCAFVIVLAFEVGGVNEFYGALYGQTRQIKAAKIYREEGKLLKAKETISLALANDKTKDNAEAWYLKSLICTQIAEDSILSKQYPEMRFEAFEAFKKVYELNPQELQQYTLTYNAGQYLISDLYGLYWQDAAKSFNYGDYIEALKNFRLAKEVQDFWVTLPNSNRPEMDTVLIFNIANSAMNVYQTNNEINRSYLDTAIVYYELLANAKISGSIYEGVYGTIAYYYYQVHPNTDKFKKYLYLGRKLFPDSKRLSNIETDWKVKSASKSGNKQKMFQAYEDAISGSIDPETKNSMIRNYIAELFAYVNPSSGARSSSHGDYDEKKARLEELYDNLLDENPNDLDLSFDYGKHFYNQFNFLKKELSPLKAQRNDLLNQIEFNKRAIARAPVSKRKTLNIKAKELKEDLNKVDKDLAIGKKQQEALVDKAIAYITPMFSKYESQHKSGSLSRHDKAKFKQLVSLISDLYDFKKDKERVKYLDGIYDSLP